MEYDMNKDLLPVGTIVKVRFSKFEYMIFGFYIKEPGDDKPFDYCALPYPWGLLNLNDMVGFDRDVIKKVVHMGYVNDEERQFKKELEEEKKKGKNHSNIEMMDL